MKKLIIVTAIVTFSITKVIAQASMKTKADLAWEALKRLPSINFFGRTEEEIITLEVQKEEFRRTHLNEALKFYQQFPRDKRAIKEILIQPPMFWADIEKAVIAKDTSKNSYSAAIDWQLFNKWEEERMRIKARVIKDVNVEENVKQQIRMSDLELEIARGKNALYRLDKRIYIEKIKRLLSETFENFRSNDSNGLIQCMNLLFYSSNSYGLNMNDLEDLVYFSKISKIPEIQEWAFKKTSFLALQKQPFQMKHHTVDGEEIDLEKLRGKVILIDFWSNTCSTCIERMPAIKLIYDKYKGKDFIVISAAINPNIDIEKVSAIHHKIGADWPLMLIGGDAKSGYMAGNSLAKNIWNKYGFSGVPQIILLDKEGKLAMFNGPLINDDFEPLIKELLAK